MTTTKTKNKTLATARQAAIYVRISDDKNGDSAGVARQEADSRALAERLGWHVARVYTENDTSAFKRRRVRLHDGSHALRVVRPAFRQLLEDLAAGLVDALVAYDLDRVARDPRDLEDLIDVVEQHELPARSVTGSLDLSNDANVTMARVMVAINNKSSRDTARRVSRKHQELAEAGRPGGGGRRAYGYASDGMTVLEHEAQVLKEIAQRILDGETTRGIVTDLNARAVPAAGGGHWSDRSLYAVVTKPRAAGLRSYRGEVIGTAAWPAILDRDTWEAVLATLAGRPKGNNTFKRWLTGVLVCGRCGTALSGWTGNVGPKYWCVPAKSRPGATGCGRLSIAAEATEATVQADVLAALARPDYADRLARGLHAEQLEGLRVEVATDEEQLKVLARLYGDRTITLPEYLEARRLVEARLERSRGVLAAHAPSVVRGLVGPELAQRWEQLSPSDRRDVTRAVFPGGLTVAPHQGDGFVRFDRARITPRAAGAA